ncbi:hypothetical protein ACLOJK_014354 [Asimina triloba]
MRRLKHIGNAWIDKHTDQDGMIDYAWDHALISDRIYRTIKNNCDFGLEDKIQNDECNQAMHDYYYLFEIIDMYSLYSPRCGTSGELQSRPLLGFGSETTEHLLKKVVAHALPFLRLIDGGGKKKKKQKKKKKKLTDLLVGQGSWSMMPRGSDPCLPKYTENYFNRPDVQEALHANVTNIPYPWQLCRTFDDWNDAPHSTLPIIKRLIEAGMRVWLYSGDTDAVVPVTSTRYTINKLGLNLTEEWTPWYTTKNEVGGWTIVYDGLTFVTLRGAGHDAPTYAPKRCRQVIQHFLADKKLPSCNSMK